MMNTRTFEAVAVQSRAMGVEVFEIGLFDPKAAPAVMLSRLWDRDTLLRSVSWLRLKNAQGRNIYIRPAGEHGLSLIDDASMQIIEQLKAEGFAPAVVVETSPGNFQAWLHHGQVLPKRLSTFAAKLLASRFGGDLAAADWRHYGRLAGFTNRKDQRQRNDGSFPYVRLHEAAGKIYSEAPTFLEEVRRLYEVQQAKSRSLAVFRQQKITRGRAKSIQDFRNNVIYGGDQTRVDLAYAVYALGHGIPENEVRRVLASRDLSHKGDCNRQQAYIDRTIKKALERTSAEKGGPLGRPTGGR